MLFINAQKFDPAQPNVHKGLFQKYEDFKKSIVRDKKSIVLKEINYPTINPTGKIEPSVDKAVPAACTWEGNEVVSCPTTPIFNGIKAIFKDRAELSSIIIRSRKVYDSTDEDGLLELFYLTTLMPKTQRKLFIIEDKEEEAKGRAHDTEKYIDVQYLIYGSESPLRDREKLLDVCRNYGIENAIKYGNYELKERLLKRVMEFDRAEKHGLAIKDFKAMLDGEYADADVRSDVVLAFDHKVLIYEAKHGAIYLSYDGKTPETKIVSINPNQDKIDVCIKYFKNRVDHLELVKDLVSDYRTDKPKKEVQVGVVTMAEYEEVKGEYFKCLSIAKKLGINGKGMKQEELREEIVKRIKENEG